MNFILPIRIAQVLIALIVLGTSAYGKRASCLASNGIILLTLAQSQAAFTTAHPLRSTSSCLVLSGRSSP